MRLSWLIMMAACTGPDSVPQVDSPDGVWLRSIDTADSGLPLDAQCADPGFCGCDYIGYDLEGPVGDDTCVHNTAIVNGELGPGAVVHANAVVSTRASLGAGATLGANSFMAPRATVGDNADIGADVTIGRASQIGARTLIGDLSSIGRDVTIGEDVDASVGSLTMGYGSFLGDRSEVTGTNVVLGNLSTIGTDSEIAANVVVARSATFGNFTVLGEGTVIGPDVAALDGLTLGAGVRVRKSTTFDEDVTVGDGVRIGRDTHVRQGAQIGDNATIRSLVTVGTFYDVEEDAYIPRGTVLEDQSGAFIADQDPVVVITSPLDGANSNSGSLTITGTVDDDFGVTSVTVRIDGGTAVSIPFSNGQFTHTVTGIPDLSQTIQVTAFDASGNEGSDLLYVSDCSPSVSISHTWTGATSSDWNTASNWSAGSVPGTSSNVFVCGDTPTQPQLAADTTLSRIYMDWDANLASDGHMLTVTSVYSGGVTSGTGTVRANSGVQLKGTVPNFVVNGDVFLSGVTVATGNTSISTGVRRLRVGAHTLRLQGNFTQSISGTDGGLYLRNALGRVSVDGNASFGGTTNMNTSSGSSPMLTGEIRVGGDFTLPCSTSADCFYPIGTQVILDGTDAQALTIVGGGSSGNRFYSLEIQNQTGVTLSGTLLANRSFSVTNGGLFTGPNVTTVTTAANNVFSGGAVLTITGTADIRGNIDVQDTSALNIASLNSRAAFTMSPTSSYMGNVVNLYGQFVIPSNNYTATNTLVRSDMSLLDDWTHTIPLLTIPTGSGRLRLNQHTLTLNGNFVQAISGTDAGLYMRNTTDIMDINGSASFGGTTNMNTTSGSSPMLAGEIRVSEDFTLPCSTSADCFYPIGTHVILDGASSQTLAITGGGSSGNRFHSLEIQNQAGVTMTGTLLANRSFSVTNGGQFTGPNVTTVTTAADNVFSDNARLTITGTADFRGNIDVQDTSTLDIASLNSRAAFTMSPASSYSGNVVNLYGQFVIPSNDYTATNTLVRSDMSLLDDWTHTIPLLTIPTGAGRLRPDNHTLTLNGNFVQAISGTDAGLYMRNVGDVVDINGSASFGGTTNMNTSSGSSPMLAGQIRVNGDFTLPCSTSADCFYPIGTHVILDGTTPQTLAITGGGSSGNRFHSLETTNQSGVTMTGTLLANRSFSLTNGGQFTGPNVTTVTTAANNVFSGGAVLTITGTADIRGNIDVQDTSALNIASLNSRAAFTMSPTSSYAGNVVNLYGQFVIPSNDYTASNTLVRSDMSLQADWTHTIPLLTIPTGAGRLRPNQHTLTLNGNFVQAISGTDAGLYMRNTSDVVDINGSANFGGTVNMNTTSASSPMLAGEIRVTGDFTLPCSTTADCFYPIGTHVILDGTSPQTLAITGGGSSGSRFHSLEITNQSGITMTGTLLANRSFSVTDGGQFTGPDVTTVTTAADNVFSDNAMLTITGTADFRGNIDVQDTSVLDIASLNSRAAFTMSPTSSYTGNVVNLYGQFVIPSNDYTASNTLVRSDMSLQADWTHTLPLLTIPTGAGRLRPNQHTLTLNGNFVQAISGTDAGLYLRNSNDVVDINGTASFGGTTNMNTSSGSSPMLAGEIRVNGDFTLPCSTSADCFYPIGTHVILDGTAPQVLSITGGGSSGNRFYSLDFANTGGTTVQGTLLANADIDILGTVNNTNTSTTNGDLTIDGGVLNNNGTFRYNNTFTNTGTLTGNTPVNF